MSKVKNIFSIVMVTVYTFAIISLTLLGMAHAEDTVLSVPIKSVIEKIDKNGQPYKRLIVSITASLNGIKYNRSVPLMVFSDMLDQVAEVKAGDQIKCIASVNDYKGRVSYTLQAIID